MFGKSNDGRRKTMKARPRVRRRTRPLSGLIAGAIGGLAATWVLDQYQKGALAVTRQAEAAAGAGPVLSQQQEKVMEEQKRAHAEAAARVARATGRKLSGDQRRHAASAVHYAVGALAGAAYGISVELVPVVKSGYGTGYASLLFVGGPQVLLPWFRLEPPPGETPAAVQVGGLSGHMIYGVTLETARRVLRWWI